MHISHTTKFDGGEFRTTLSKFFPEGYLIHSRAISSILHGMHDVQRVPTCIK